MRVYLDVSVDDVVVVAVAQRLQDLPHVVAEKSKLVVTSLFLRENQYELREENSPGHRFAVDKAGVRPLHDLKAQVCSVHTNRDRSRERERDVVRR